MKGVAIAGIGMTQFGKQVGRGVRSLALAAIEEAIADSGLASDRIDRIYFGNAISGIISQQEMVRGQVALRHQVLGKVPLFNIENACASGGSAFSLACEAVASGAVEVALVVGAEQMNHVDRSRPFNALRGSTDIEEIGESEPGQISANSLLMDFYAAVAQRYLDESGAELSDFARVAVKNRKNATMNLLAHLRTPQSLEDVLASRMIVAPLSLPMCSPVTDGAAAIIVCSDKVGASIGHPVVQVKASAVASGASGNPVGDAAAKAYTDSSVGSQDFDVIELHDAAAPAELMQYHEIGLCAKGDGFRLIRDGVTDLGGATPVNTSGGLLSRGHPLGATGCAQIVELVHQLRGTAGARQVEGARLALAVNGGGWLDGTYALAIATVLARS
ncbi:thiolase family protein [Sphingorhabdus sp.]|uniref:thiolase family protein n=3 Tax=Sphingorhabdus sp. TaxID=1902408 RepID=UPI0037C588D0|nr:thiolase family protein [Sphingomonadaceae bacterium]